MNPWIQALHDNPDAKVRHFILFLAVLGFKAVKGIFFPMKKILF